MLVLYIFLYFLFLILSLLTLLLDNCGEQLEEDPPGSILEFCCTIITAICKIPGPPCSFLSDALRRSQTQSDTQKFSYFRLSIDPVIVERCIIARWNRLVETNRMVANSSFYDRWIARYLTKRQESAFLHLHYCAIWRFAKYLCIQWS